MSQTHADRRVMQDRLFGALSDMFGREVPMYDKSLLINGLCNRVVCDFLARRHGGFSVSDAVIEKTSGERHGAIRIGRPDEYRWITRLFACFAMEPHNFYDMTSIGAKSQPIVATAFRSSIEPEHRVFSSLLQTSYFDAATRERIEALLAQRDVFSDTARGLIEMSERDGGLVEDDASALIDECTGRIFKWTGEARDFLLYTELCESGFKIAADIACFGSHHLNHLTPNTLWMDLYTSAMKHAMGELDGDGFTHRATRAIEQLRAAADRDFLRLSFRHLRPGEIDAFDAREVSDDAIGGLVDGLKNALSEPEHDLTRLEHSGFKSFTEGPPVGVPVLLRQDAYKALTEPAVFTNPDGTTTEAEHTARFGEIEQRFYATTPEGRTLYDECLPEAEKVRVEDPDLAARDFEAYQRACAEAFSPFPGSLPGLLERGLVHGLYEPTDEGHRSSGSIDTTDIHELVRRGLVRVDGLRYEDFLPVSAAGIFASNLNQYGTAPTADERPAQSRSMLEDIMGRPVVDTAALYAGMEARSLLDTYAALDLLDDLGAAELARLRGTAASLDRIGVAASAPA